MNKKVILIVVALLILVAVGAGAIIMKKSPLSTSSENTSPIATQTEQGQPQAGSGSLKDLLFGGKAQKCTYTDNTQETAVNTTIYVANGKMRGDINTTSKEFSIKSHMIVDSTYTYFWSENSNQGFKIPIEKKAAVTPSQQNQSVDLDQKLNYTCENWNEVDSFFDLPANITFQTMTIPTAVPSGLDNGSANPMCSLRQPSGRGSPRCL